MAVVKAPNDRLAIANARVLSANPLLAYEKPTQCRLSERSDAEGQHPCCRSARTAPIAVEGHSKHLRPT